jgi:hypothetical protein
MTVAMLGIPPVFYSGLLLILFFSFTLTWFPAPGQADWAAGTASNRADSRRPRSGATGPLQHARGVAPGYVVTARARASRRNW